MHVASSKVSLQLDYQFHYKGSLSDFPGEFRSQKESRDYEEKWKHKTSHMGNLLWCEQIFPSCSSLSRTSILIVIQSERRVASDMAAGGTEGEPP